MADNSDNGDDAMEMGGNNSTVVADNRHQYHKLCILKINSYFDFCTVCLDKKETGINASLHAQINFRSHLFYHYDAYFSDLPSVANGIS